MAIAASDAADVHAALRLGWLMAEVRGRARPDGPGGDVVTDMARGYWVLPLGSERSPAEREVEAEHALGAIAKGLEVDAPVTSPQAAGVPAGPNYSDEMSRLGKLVADQRKQHDPQVQTAWRDFARLLYLWDAKIQDDLMSRSDRLANAYELGRALAETYWALNPNAPSRVQQGEHNRLNPVSWEFLLGADRLADIARLLARLGPYFTPLAASVVAGSLQIWGRVAADENWRTADNAQNLLLQQIRNWYSLLVADLDPETMLKPYAILRSWRIFKRAFQAFGMEMVVGLIGILSIVAFGLLLAYAPQLPALKAATAVLGVLGVTSAGLQTRLKTTTQSMIARLSADLTTELVTEQTTITPDALNAVKVKQIRQQAIESRTVTAPLAR